MKKLPSIFNDVIGPVMRGPSSSHTAASWRIAKCCLDILGEPLKKALIDFDKEGAWAPNFREQGTAMGIEAGLLGIAITDKRMKNTSQVAIQQGISIQYEINSFPTNHANTVRLLLNGVRGKQIQVVAASLGGGSFEIQQINGIDLKISGDYYELLVFDEVNELRLQELKSEYPQINTISQSANSGALVNIKSSKPFVPEEVERIKRKLHIDKIVALNPVVPIISGNECKFPFSTLPSLFVYAEKESLSLGELGLIYEGCRSGLSKEQLFDKMSSLVEIIEKSIEVGLNGTVYEDRILHQQAHLIEKASKSGKITNNTLLNQLIANVTAIMESKSGMEVIVANPTAGSCGTVGGAIKAVSDELNSSSDEIVNAYFAAGLAGAYFAQGPGFSAEEHGCQVECGAASGMAAAGIAQLFGATAKQAIDSASMAVQNSIGLICDPVADRVEVPCLGKNVNAAMNALSSAIMVCSGFDAVIPYEEVIQTVSRVSKQMPSCVKCTGKGGLAITTSAIKLKKSLS